MKSKSEARIILLSSGGLMEVELIGGGMGKESDLLIHCAKKKKKPGVTPIYISTCVHKVSDFKDISHVLKTWLMWTVELIVRFHKE